MNKFNLLLSLFFFYCVQANAQYEKLKAVQLQKPNALMPFNLVPVCALGHNGDIILAGKIELGGKEDVKEYESAGYGRYRAGLICVDKNFAVRWKIHFTDLGDRREITQIVPKNDSVFYVWITGKKTKYADESCILQTISYSEKILENHAFEETSRDSKIFINESGNLLVASTGSDNPGGGDSSFISLTLMDKNFKPLQRSKTYIGKKGNKGEITSISPLGKGYLLTGSLGRSGLFGAGIYYANEKLELQKTAWFFGRKNTEADLVIQENNNTFWLGCNATPENDENAGLALIKLDENFTSLCTLHFGKSRHNDVINIYNEPDRLVIAHEAAESQFRGHDKEFSGISLVDKNCGLISTQSFREKIDEKTIALLPREQGYLLISKTNDSVENLDEQVSAAYYGIRFRVLDHNLKVTKQFELGNF